MLSGLLMMIICLALVVQPTPAAAEAMKSAQRLIAQGKWAEAETILEKWVEEHPQAGVGWMQLGLVRHSQKKWDSALEAHLKAAEFRPLQPTALYNAACVYSIRAETEKALDALRRAVTAGFSDREQFFTDGDLAHVRSDTRFHAVLPPLLEGKALFAEAHQVLHTLVGETANDEFGWLARKVGDVDGDQVMDFVVTAPGFQGGAGKIYVYSGKTGKALFTRTGRPGQRYGNGAAAAGDINADGTPDVVVGAPMGRSGLVEVLSGKDGQLLLVLNGDQPGEQFGYKVCGLGDLDGDGHADVAVSALACRGRFPGSGRCLGYSGKDGKKLFELQGTRGGDKFGSAIAASLDTNHPMIAVGAQDAGPGQRGKVYVYRFQQGTPQPAFIVDADSSARDLGQMFVSFPGDLNGDGVPDIYCSDFSDSAQAPGAGRVLVVSGTDGKKLLDLTGKIPGEGLGTSPSDAGDVDGDGVGDLVVGAWQNREKGRSAGKVYLYSGPRGNLLKTWTCRQLGETFGFDATGLGDTNSDGHHDFLISAAWSTARGPKTGRVFILAGSEQTNLP